jgi:hypothetical protein
MPITPRHSKATGMPYCLGSLQSYISFSLYNEMVKNEACLPFGYKRMGIPEILIDFLFYFVMINLK